MKYFENAKVGDKVWDMVFGDGEIVGFGDHPMQMDVSFNNRTIVVSMCGRLHRALKCNQTCFYADDRPLVYYPDWEKEEGAVCRVQTQLHIMRFFKNDIEPPTMCTVPARIINFDRPKEDDEVTVKLSRKTLELLKEQGIKVVGT